MYYILFCATVPLSKRLVFDPRSNSGLGGGGGGAWSTEGLLDALSLDKEFLGTILNTICNCTEQIFFTWNVDPYLFTLRIKRSPAWPNSSNFTPSI